MIQITFLGTSSMVPTKERNVQAIFVKFDTEGLLFDCGEGTQRQMNIAGINRLEITRIFITHWHGDHMAGLIGLIQTLGNNKEEVNLEIHGPKETKKRLASLIDSCIFDQKVNLKVFEHTAPKLKTIIETEEFKIDAVELEHGVPTIGYSFIEKDRRRIKTAYLRSINVPDGPHLQKLQEGKSFVYKSKSKNINVDVEKATFLVEGKKLTLVPDTRLCNNAVELAKDADVLICESTYSSQHIEKAEQYKHMTAAHAAELALQANAKKLVLTHFSQRYKTLHDVEEDAKMHFDNVVLAYDFLKIKL